jgi:RNA polymerase sigma-70 factor (ECF subfamily)
MSVKRSCGASSPGRSVENPLLRAALCRHVSYNALVKNSTRSSRLPPLEKDDERRLVALSQRGDIDAFDALVRAYEKPVYNLAYRMTGNYDDANDVSSEAFVRVFNAIGRFRGESAFSTWLYRIATNVFLDERKRRRSHPQVSLDDDFDVEGSNVQRQIEDPSPGPDALAETQEQRRTLDAAIQQLPDFQREMITMYHVLNMSYEQIGDITGAPIGTVKSRLNRARLALRDVLEQSRDLFSR